MSKAAEPAKITQAPLLIRPFGGANCSSVGSVVDMLFVAGVAGGALLVAVTAALDDLDGSGPTSTSPLEEVATDHEDED